MNPGLSVYIVASFLLSAFITLPKTLIENHISVMTVQMTEDQAYQLIPPVAKKQLKIIHSIIELHSFGIGQVGIMQITREWAQSNLLQIGYPSFKFPILIDNKVIYQTPVCQGFSRQLQGVLKTKGITTELVSYMNKGHFNLVMNVLDRNRQPIQLVIDPTYRQFFVDDLARMGYREKQMPEVFEVLKMPEVLIVPRDQFAKKMRVFENRISLIKIMLKHPPPQSTDIADRP